MPSFHRDLALALSTYALERSAPSEHADLDVLRGISIGQGSGICGCISARDALTSRPRSSASSPPWPRPALLRRCYVVPTASADTLADGMATRVPDEEALDVIVKGASRIALVRDDEIAAAIRAYWTDTISPRAQGAILLLATTDSL